MNEGAWAPQALMGPREAFVVVSSGYARRPHNDRRLENAIEEGYELITTTAPVVQAIVSAGQRATERARERESARAHRHAISRTALRRLFSPYKLFRFCSEACAPVLPPY